MLYLLFVCIHFLEESCLVVTLNSLARENETLEAGFLYTNMI